MAHDELQTIGRFFTKLSDYDTAWRAYNRAITTPSPFGYLCPTHSVRNDMAAMLLKEGRPKDAVWNVALAYFEMKQPGPPVTPPKYLERTLERALKRLGYADPKPAEEIKQMALWAHTTTEFKEQLSRMLNQPSENPKDGS